MILKVLLAIGLVILIVYCLITLFTDRFLPGGLIRSACIIGSVILFRWLIHPSRD